MTARREEPAVEAIIERTVRTMTANALYSLTAALGPLRRREETYGRSEVFRLLEAAEESTKRAARAVEAWKLRTAPQADAFEPPESAFELDPTPAEIEESVRLRAHHSDQEES